MLANKNQRWLRHALAFERWSCCSRNSSPIRRSRECAIPCEMKRMHFHPASRFATFHSRKPPLVLLDPSNSLENVRHFDYDSSSLKPRRLTVSLRNQKKGKERKKDDRGRKVRKWKCAWMKEFECWILDEGNILKLTLIRCYTFLFFFFFAKFLNNVKYLRFNYTMASHVFSLMS